MDGTLSSQTRLAYALKQIRFYGKGLKFGIPKDTYNNKVIQNGLTAPFNSEEELEAKKLLISAAVETVYNSQKVPDDCKEEVATLNAREILEMFDFVKVECTDMTQEEKMKRLEKNSFAKRAARLKATNNKIRDSLYLLHSAHVIYEAGTGDLTALGFFIMLEMIPQSWKDTIFDKSIQVINYASNRVHYEIEYQKCCRANKKENDKEKSDYKNRDKEKVKKTLLDDEERQYGNQGIPNMNKENGTGLEKQTEIQSDN